MNDRIEPTKDAVALLVERARTNDETAFGELYSLYRSNVYHRCLMLLKNPLEAEDVTQQVFFKAWRKVGTFQGKCQFKTWLYRIATNFSLGYIRTKASQEARAAMVSLEGFPDHSDESASPLARAVATHDADPEITLQQAQLRTVLLEKIRTLPPKQMETLLLRFFSGKTTPEVAEIMNCTHGTVKSNQFKAVQFLRQDEDFHSLYPIRTPHH